MREDCSSAASRACRSRCRRASAFASSSSATHNATPSAACFSLARASRAHCIRVHTHTLRGKRYGKVNEKERRAEGRGEDYELAVHTLLFGRAQHLLHEALVPLLLLGALRRQTPVQRRVHLCLWLLLVNGLECKRLDTMECSEWLTCVETRLLAGVQSLMMIQYYLLVQYTIRSIAHHEVCY